MVIHPQSKVIDCIDPMCHVFIMAGLCGLVIFVMYVTGAEMMMEVMVGNFFLFEVFSTCLLDLLTLLAKETKVENIK